MACIGKSKGAADEGKLLEPYRVRLAGLTEKRLSKRRGELDSAKDIDLAMGRVGTLSGLAAKPGAKLYYEDDEEDSDQVLSEPLSSQDPFIRTFRDKHELDKAKTTTAGHPDATTMSYSLLGGSPHFCDGDLVHRYNWDHPDATTVSYSLLGGSLHLCESDLVHRYSRNHPDVLFGSSGDAACFGEVTGKVKEGRLEAVHRNETLNPAAF